MTFDRQVSKSNVLVIGDAMLDTWHYFESYRLSPEANIPIVRKNHAYHAVGGAGNALRHLKSLSDSSHCLIATVGVDFEGLLMREVALENGLEIDWVEVNRITTTKKRMFVDGNPVLREDIEDTSTIDNSYESMIFTKIASAISRFDVLLISDYAKGLLSENLIIKIRALANSALKPLVVDPGVNRIDLYAGYDFIKPNLKEWQIYVESVGDEIIAIQKLIKAGTRGIVITLGPQGIRYINQNFESEIISPDRQISAVDVTGAGDSVAAALSLRAGNGSLSNADFRFMNEVGANTVSKIRTEI